MGRIRTIKPEFFQSRSLAQCPIEARLTFAGLWTQADDHGRGRADPRLLKGQLWPLDDDCTFLHLSAHLDVLAETGHIRLYEVDGEPYYEILHWSEHQAPAYRRGAARYPSPPKGSSGLHDSARQDVQENEGACREVQKSAGSGSGEQGTGNEDQSPQKPPTDPPMLPGERWALEWCDITGITPTRSVLKVMIPKVTEFIAAHGAPTRTQLEEFHRRGIKTPGGWGWGTADDGELSDEEWQAIAEGRA